MAQTHLILGASRGIGYEFTSQLLARGHNVIATQRAATATGSKLAALQSQYPGGQLAILECDVSSEASILGFVARVREALHRETRTRAVLDVVVLNAGVLVYPNRMSELSFANFSHHLTTNTIGPLLAAQHLLKLSQPEEAAHKPVDIKTLVFISSDSGSTTNFRSFEDGFGAYAASKAALNQGLRHLAAEVHRKHPNPPVVLALHPGEVTTDMAANVEVDWEVKGVIGPEESIECMLKVIEEKGAGGADEGGRVSMAKDGLEEETGAATFWTWDGRRYPW
ncbi:hypothetical protein BP6252_04180 [Coleophoma cylindrospora]|uniref:NAD(P)-binding protein n=1 Tax=Coleophoma cylindrospora TaxID=1849047 RepID=A0A3D8RZS0_9HELO|nr:hypothetical protein BP6252_04180 [Coleophoma cylindrospora]